jgi:hypothetical protein
MFHSIGLVIPMVPIRVLKRAQGDLNDLHQDGFRQLYRQMIDRTDGSKPCLYGTRAVIVESPASQAGQYPPQCSGANVFATDVPRQGDNAEAGDRGPLQAEHVVTQEPGRQSHDHFGLRLIRTAKSPKPE